MILPIIKPRAGGKSTTLIEWVLGDPLHRTILCANTERANRLTVEICERVPKSLHGTGQLRHVAISVQQLSHLDGLKDQLVAIDDLDEVLHRWIRQEIHAFTMTGPSHDGEGRELVDKDAVYAFVNQRPVEPERPTFTREEFRYLIEDALAEARFPTPVDGVMTALVNLLDAIQHGSQGKPPLISPHGQIRKSGEVITFSNGVTMPLDMVLMMGHMNMIEDASRPSPE